MPSTPSPPVARLIALGLLIWLVVTLAFRLVGHLVLVPGDPLRTALLFAAAFPLVYLLMNAILRAQRVRGTARVVAATLLLGPGLLLDGLVSIPWFGVVLPNMDAAVASLYGALMCAGYGTGLFVGLLPGWRGRDDAARRSAWM